MESRIVPPPQASARQTELGDKFNRVLFAALDALQSRNIPFALIGGIAASGMGRPRSTHDIDIFVRPEDSEAALEALEPQGFDTERTDIRWLFKGWKEDMMVDIIFKSQGDIYFDTEMQQRAKMIHYHGRDIPAVAPEDLVIIKAAVHSEVGPHHWHDALAILSHATLDWNYLLKRARRAPRRLLALLIYAQSNDIWIPNHVVHDLYHVIFGPSHQKPMAPESYHMRNGAAHATMSQGAASSAPQVQPQAQQAHQPRNPDAYLVGHLQEALAADPKTASLDVQMTVGGKKILVKGECPSANCRQNIEEVIRKHAAGFDVDNQVHVMEMSAPEVEELV